MLTIGIQAQQHWCLCHLLRAINIHVDFHTISQRDCHVVFNNETLVDNPLVAKVRISGVLWPATYFDFGKWMVFLMRTGL